MDTELLKLGVVGVLGIIFVYAIGRFFDFMSRRMGPHKNGNGSTRAGDIAPEIYLARFDKLDGAVSGMVKIMEKQTEILGDIRDWVIKQG